MSTQLCIFEDRAVTNLHPLVYTRPACDLRCGVLTLREKIAHAYAGMPLALRVRPYLAPLVREQHPGLSVNGSLGDACLFINGRVLVDAAFRAAVTPEGPDVLYLSGQTPVGARLSGKNLRAVLEPGAPLLDLGVLSEIDRQELSTPLIGYPWDLVAHNGEQIGTDLAILAPRAGTPKAGTVYPGAHLVGSQNIWIGEGSKVKPGVVLDAEAGPIVIGRNVTIYPNATIEGPAAIGDNSKIKIGAKIYEGTTIGPLCKVGGEVEESIIHAASNKQHDGFLGHAYLGMWVNLGADTNNSDLKNNYGEVRVIINGEPVNSGSMFVGLTMGDHSKAGINTMFNTGTVVGVSSNVFGAGFPPKYVPSFSWGGAERLTTYDPVRALEVARRVMQRRDRALSAAEEAVLREVFALTRAERRAAGME
jgi:UDP-N-acetylglucosamine diphosphorylase/glucosamine-1-phosphate N-acetyltransferase